MRIGAIWAAALAAGCLWASEEGSLHVGAARSAPGEFPPWMMRDMSKSKPETELGY